jgi:alpha-L-fucosidase
MKKTDTMKNEEKPMKDTKQQWFKDAKYGLFIHWGLYSILAGEYKGVKTDRIAEWIENHLDIPVEEYEKLVEQFHPTQFDADSFVKRAKEQWGMKYIVLTAKHHEGFAMYDSKVSDFNVVKATPYGRDILKDLQLACEKYQIRLGIYYSQAQDWDDPDGYMANKDNSQKNFQKYFDEKCKPQVKELLENYGKLCLIWFDTPMGITVDQTQELIDLVKSIQPDCLLSGRTGNHMGDYMTTGDNYIPRLPYEGDWEVPATVNNTWGFNRFDTHWKSADQILQLLLKIVSRGGNYLLNVGPTADGVVPPACVDVLNEVGDYVISNGEAIYGTKPVGIYPYEIPGIEFTRREHKLYVHVLSPRIRIELLNIGNELTGAYLVSNHQKLEYFTGITCEGDGVVEVALPTELHSEKNYCVCLELVEEEPIFESIKS